MKLHLKDFTKTPCLKWLPRIEEFADAEGYTDYFEMFEKYKPGYGEVSWLIRYCPKAQTTRFFEYYLSLNPGYEYVSWLIFTCPKAQTQEFFDYYFSLNPSYENVIALIIDCPKFEEYYNNRKTK